jgi:hypothetical protein
MDTVKSLLSPLSGSLASSGMLDGAKLLILGGTVETARRVSSSAWSSFVNSFFLTAHFSEEDYREPRCFPFPNPVLIPYPQSVRLATLLASVSALSALDSPVSTGTNHISNRKQPQWARSREFETTVSLPLQTHCPKNGSFFGHRHAQLQPTETRIDVCRVMSSKTRCSRTRKPTMGARA